MQNFQYLKNNKSFSDKIKEIFHNFKALSESVVSKEKNSGHKF